MLEQRDVDLLRSDAQIEIEFVVEEFNKAYYGGRYAYRNSATNGLEQQNIPEQPAEGEPQSAELPGGGNIPVQ